METICLNKMSDYMLKYIFRLMTIEVAVSLIHVFFYKLTSVVFLIFLMLSYGERLMILKELDSEQTA